MRPYERGTYLRLRSEGVPCWQAMRAARCEFDWECLERRGFVRLRVEYDEISSYQEGGAERFGFVSEVFEGGAWINVDSIWGCDSHKMTAGDAYYGTDLCQAAIDRALSPERKGSERLRRLDSGVIVSEAWAWPGAYPLVYLGPNDEVRCSYCAHAGDRSDVHWEGEPLSCDECENPIESAYGPIVEEASS